MSPTVCSSSATSAPTAESVASSASSRARSKSSALSFSLVPRAASVETTPSSCFLSLPSSCARLGSFQMPGSSSALATATSRSDLASKSKIPPQIGSALLQSGKRVGYLIDLLGFHIRSIHSRRCTLYSALPAASRVVDSCCPAFAPSSESPMISGMEMRRPEPGTGVRAEKK